MLTEPVVVDAVRTPIGRAGGVFRNVRPDALLATAITGLLTRSHLPPASVDDLFIGCVTQFGEQSGNVARLAGLLAGLPASVPGLTINRACGSGQEAIHSAARAVAAGDARYLVAGGVESMSRSPMFADADGTATVASRLATMNPELAVRFEMIGQGESAERLAAKYGLTREDLDEWALRSQRRAAAAAAEITGRDLVAIDGVSKDGAPIAVSGDESVRPASSLERLAVLNPAFRSDGVVTAGNSSPLSDGAAVVLIADRAVAEADGHRPRARFRARIVTGGDPTMQLDAIMPATSMALTRAGLRLQDIDAFEINEAFASVVLAWLREFEVDPDRVNADGGAIAHGHPLGATGAVLLTKLIRRLERTGGTFGLQVMCVARGMATATIVERI